MNNKEKRFYKNIELWSESHPKEALMLPYIDGGSLKFCETEQKELNLTEKHYSLPFFYHPQSGAKEESNRWFNQLHLETTDVLFVYGVGLGYDYEAARSWLKKKKSRLLIFLEDNLAVIRCLLATDLGTRLIKDSQVKLHYFKETLGTDPTLEALYWGCARKSLKISSLRSYASAYQEKLTALSHQIAYDTALKNALVDEYMRFGGAFFINYYQNLLLLPNSYLGNGLFGKFKDIPVIICGAGPSLEKNVHLLAALKNKALIFAGGSAMNVLNAAGIQPHFGAGIDPNSTQYERLRTNHAFEIPYFYRNRMFHDAFKLIHGPRLYITGSGGYDIAKYFEEKLQLQAEEIEEGHNVVNFCIEIAYALGCRTILLAGVDLAFTAMRTYAPGAEETPSEIVFDVKADDDRPLLKKDIHGQPVYTLWKWIAEAEWISDFAKTHHDVELINATEGGLGIPAISHETLESASKRLLKKEYDLAGRIHTEIQQNRLKEKIGPRLTIAVKELENSLKRCVKAFNLLIRENKRLLTLVQEEKKEELPPLSGLAVLAETELGEEAGYQYICDIFNAVYTRLCTAQLLKIKHMTTYRRHIKYLKLNIQRLRFCKNTARVNLALIHYAKKNYDS